MKKEELIAAVAAKTGLTVGAASLALAVARAEDTGLVYLGWSETNPNANPAMASNGGGYNQPEYRWLTASGDIISVLDEDKGEFGWECWLTLPDDTIYWVGVDQSGKSIGWWAGVDDDAPGWRKAQQQAQEGAAKAAFLAWGPMLEEVSDEEIFPSVVKRWAEE